MLPSHCICAFYMRPISMINKSDRRPLSICFTLTSLHRFQSNCVAGWNVITKRWCLNKTTCLLFSFQETTSEEDLFIDQKAGIIHRICHAEKVTVRKIFAMLWLDSQVFLINVFHLGFWFIHLKLCQLWALVSLVDKSSEFVSE